MYQVTGILQPRVGIDLEESKKTLFTQIFAGSGGVDSYTNAISDTYQDNFGEGIYTGKGIYDLNVFNTVMKDKIKENTVLSHDLLEGCYLRCGLCSDIMLLDGYPKSYLSYLARLNRWTRGDYQICGYLKRGSNLNLLSKFKILDNIRRSLLEISVILSFIALVFLKMYANMTVGLEITIILLGVVVPSVLDLLKVIIFRKENVKRQKQFTKDVSGLEGSLLRAVISLFTLPTTAYSSMQAIFKTIYRMKVSREHLLEWTTSEEAERQNKNSVFLLYKKMIPNVVVSIVLFIGLGFAPCSIAFKVFMYAVSFGFLICPFAMYRVSIVKNKAKAREKLADGDIKYIKDIAEKTWEYFADFMNKDNFYLPPDNYQESRREKIVLRTSSTNIGLGLLTIVASYDLGFIDLEKAILYLENVLKTVQNLDKWNGHLYNWYDIRTLLPLKPRYVSTVDSGNFIRIYVHREGIFRRKAKYSV